MPHPLPPSQRARTGYGMTLLQGAIALAGAATLTACAPLPTTSSSAQMHEARLMQASAGLDAGAALWPSDQWWTRYGDAQLNALIEDALRGAPDLDVAKARLAAAEGLADQQHAALRPTLEATGSALDTKGSLNYLSPASAVPRGWQVYGNTGLQASADLDLWGRNRAAFAAATSSLQAARADTAQARVALTTSVAAAYIRLDELYATRDTAQAALEVREQSSALFEKRRENGLETQGSVRQMDARSASARGDLLAIDEQIALQRNELAALLGAGPDRGATIARPALRVRAGQGLPAALPVNLLGRRPDLIAARLRVEATARKIDVARASFYPNVNLSAGIGLQSVGLETLFHASSVFGSFGPAISLPLFDQGRLRGQYTQAEASYAEAVAQYNATLVRALRDVADAAASERALGGELQQAEAAVAAARDAWRVAQERYQGGLANHLEVLTAQDTLLSSQRELTRLQARSLSLDVTLTRALGGGFDGALAPLPAAQASASTRG